MGSTSEAYVSKLIFRSIYARCRIAYIIFIWLKLISRSVHYALAHRVHRVVRAFSRGKTSKNFHILFPQFVFPCVLKGKFAGAERIHEDPTRADTAEYRTSATLIIAESCLLPKHEVSLRSKMPSGWISDIVQHDPIADRCSGFEHRSFGSKPLLPQNAHCMRSESSILCCRLIQGNV